MGRRGTRACEWKFPPRKQCQENRFPIAHMEEMVRCRFVAREDNHQDVPPLITVRADMEERYVQWMYVKLSSTPSLMRLCTFILDATWVKMVTVGVCGKLCMGDGWLPTCGGRQNELRRTRTAEGL